MIQEESQSVQVEQRLARLEEKRAFTEEIKQIVADQVAFALPLFFFFLTSLSCNFYLRR